MGKMERSLGTSTPIAWTEERE